MMHRVDYPSVIVSTVASPRDAYDFDYYAQRLTEPLMVERGGAVRTLHTSFLAYPVGNVSHGEYFPVSCRCLAAKVRVLLAEQPGFSQPWLWWSPYPDGCPIAEWGERPPNLRGVYDRTALGCFYGYSEAAIAASPGAAPKDSLSGRARTVFPPRHRSWPKRARLLTREDEHHVCAQPAVPHG
ncbi:DUF6302 family protein [Streptomyces sp. NPDC019224]|uniref:DUF6302 family protein n=1 Tax=Streptomyces sp. NPDC019224 TaxID=3154484 RepID=UPI0033CA9CA2